MFTKKPRHGPVERAARVALLSEKAMDYLCVGLILVTASVLILSNLGNIYLWGDEAHTAMLAKTILAHGIPTGYDGKNYFSQQLGHDCTRNYVWIWHPWFPFYLLAGFFAAFGASTFTARLPFALMGMATILLTYYYGKSLWHSRRAALIAAALLILSVPFLLLARQCRYYSLTAVLSLAGLCAYTEILKGTKRSLLVFGASAFLLFHTHYISCAALLATTIVHTLIFRRDRLKSVIIACAIVTAACAPWIILFAGMGQVVSGYQDRTFRVVYILKSFASQIGSHIFPPWLLALPVLAVAWHWLRRKNRPSPYAESLSNVTLMILFSAVSVMALAATAQVDYFRYLAPLIPVLCLLTGLIIEWSMRVHPVIGVAVLLLLVSRGQLPDYLYEITHDYDGPSEGIVEYLRQNAGPNDVVATNHENLPIVFYTGLRVIAGVTGEDYSAAKDADWVILRKYVTQEEHPITSYLVQNLDRDKYEAITIPYPDIQFENREDPKGHLFRTDQDEELVVILHRIQE